MNNNKIKSYLDSLDCTYHFSKRIDDRTTTLFSNTNNTNKELTFPLYSITKTIIASLILHQVDKGILSLDDKVNKHLKEFQNSFFNKITIYDLLNHRSGLGDYGYTKEYKTLLTNDPTSPPTEEFLIEVTLKQTNKLKEKSAFLYSNTGYLLLKKILENIYRKNFQWILNEVFFKPLNLTNTKLALIQNDFHNINFPCEPSLFFNGLDAREVYHPNWVGHGLITSTPKEVTKLYSFIFSDNFLSKESMGLLLKPKKLNFESKFFKPHYGLGVLGDINSSLGVYIGHDGNGPGYSVGVFKVNECFYCLVLGKENLSVKDIIFELINKK